VKDSAGQKLGYFYYEEELGRRSAAEARRIAANVAKLRGPRSQRSLRAFKAANALHGGFWDEETNTALFSANAAYAPAPAASNAKR
jgi:hypothetical protein